MNILVHFNEELNDPQKPTLFMVHPGGGGVEAYVRLVQTLEKCFNCIGVDNYNVLHPGGDLGQTLEDLTELYLREMMSYFRDCVPRNLWILGWSLGGKIGMELAVRLGELGLSSVHVVMLDTFNDDPYSIANMQFACRSELEQKALAINRARNSKPGSRCVKVTLFKAGNVLDGIPLTEYDLKERFGYNGYDDYTEWVDIVPLDQADHETIMQEPYIDTICTFLVTAGQSYGLKENAIQDS
mmetsp:Transcript_2968/g.5583  ORF Transcript_2968/g.5583 Transcript_2968/m.5583 type:complete len:241 (-) Transcript_2968:262-984(-)